MAASETHHSEALEHQRQAIPVAHLHRVELHLHTFRGPFERLIRS